MLQGPPLSGFKFLHGAQPYVPARALSMKVDFLQGALPSVEPLTDTNFIRRYYGDWELILPRAGVACYNRLFSQSIVTRHRGVGGIFLPWGKGLTGLCQGCVLHVAIKLGGWYIKF